MRAHHSSKPFSGRALSSFPAMEPRAKRRKIGDGSRSDSEGSSSPPYHETSAAERLLKLSGRLLQVQGGMRLEKLPTHADIKAMSVGELLATRDGLAKVAWNLQLVQRVVQQETQSRTVTFQVTTVSGELMTIVKPVDSTVSSLKADCLRALQKPLHDRLDYKIVIDGNVCSNTSSLLEHRPAKDGDAVQATLVRTKRDSVLPGPGY